MFKLYIIFNQVTPKIMTIICHWPVHYKIASSGPAKTVWSKEEGKPMMVERKLGGAVDESSADHKIRKYDATVHYL